MDDAQKRAQQFNDQQRIAELEEEVAALNDLMESMSRVRRKSTKELKQSLRALIAHAEATRKITSAQLARARWRVHDNDKKPCPTCARGYGAIVADFAELQTKLADPAQLRAHYAAVHGHGFDAAERREHCGPCHAVGLITRAAERRRAPKKATKTTREDRRKIIREAGAKDRAVLDRLRDHDKKP